MSLNLRCRHDISAKKKVAVLADDGWGWDAISSALALPGDTVKQWIMTYRAVGMDGLSNMGSKKKTYDYETKLAAARAHVDGGRTLQDVMAAYGVPNRASVRAWCRLYREGGLEAQAQGQAARIARGAAPRNARAAARGARKEA